MTGKEEWKIELVKEDLHIYTVCDCIENQYYVTTEVPMIRLNKPESFLPMQIRDTDGVKTVYYEITGRCSFPNWVKSGKIGYGEFRRMLEGLRQLLKDIEDYMLSLDQVSFRKEEIYLDEKGSIFWLYTPCQEENTQKRMEDLLLFILSAADYHDREALDLIYRTLHRLKNEGFSQRVLEELTEDKICHPEDNLPSGALSEPIIHGEEDSCRKETKLHPARIFILLFMGVDLAAFLYLCYCVSIRGSTIFLTLCLTIVILLFVIMLTKGLSNLPKKEVSEATGSDKEKCQDEYKDIWEDDFQKKWGEESYDETVFLSLPSNFDKPFLSSRNSDQSIEIQVLPFYIGSEAGLNQLSIKNRAVSRQHAVITRGEEDGYYLKDLGSTNGTSVNRKKALPEELILLKEGDEICFADDRWTFHF